MKNNKSMQLNWCNTISEFCEKINNELNTHICEFDFDWFDTILEINVYCQVHDLTNHMVIDVYSNSKCEYCGYGVIKTYDELYNVIYENALKIKNLYFKKSIIEPTNNAVVFALNAYFENVYFENEPMHSENQYCILVDDIVNDENYYRIFLKYDENAVDIIFQYVDTETDDVIDLCTYATYLNKYLRCDDLLSDDIVTLIISVLNYHMRDLQFDNE